MGDGQTPTSEYAVARSIHGSIDDTGRWLLACLSQPGGGLKQERASCKQADGQGSTLVTHTRTAVSHEASGYNAAPCEGQKGTEYGVQMPAGAAAPPSLFVMQGWHHQRTSGVVVGPRSYLGYSLDDRWGGPCRKMLLRGCRARDRVKDSEPLLSGKRLSSPGSP
jgi:hypothetical protein